MAGPRKVTLSAGGGACDNRTQMFVERDTAEGACVSSEQLEGLFRSLEAARAPDRRLVSSPPSAVTRIEITDGTDRLVLVRASAGSWRLEAPKASTLIDPRAVDDWLAALGHVDARPLSAAFHPHVRHLLVEGRYREQADISPGDPGYPLVDPDPLRFRDRAVLDFAHFDARGLRRTALAANDRTRQPPTATTGARSRRPARAADRTNAARVVGALGNLRAEAFLAASARGRAGGDAGGRRRSRRASRRRSTTPSSSTKRKRRPAVPDASIVTSLSRSPRRSATSSAWG